MQHTSNYGFNLPDNSDYFDIAHQNSNWSNIDNAMDDLDRRASALTDMAVKGYVATSLLVSDTQMLTDDDGNSIMADRKTDADALKTEITQLSTQMQKTDIILQNLREAVSDINKRLLKLELS